MSILTGDWTVEVLLHPDLLLFGTWIDTWWWKKRVSDTLIRVDSISCGDLVIVKSLHNSWPVAYQTAGRQLILFCIFSQFNCVIVTVISFCSVFASHYS